MASAGSAETAWKYPFVIFQTSCVCVCLFRLNVYEFADTDNLWIKQQKNYSFFLLLLLCAHSICNTTAIYIVGEITNTRCYGQPNAPSYTMCACVCLFRYFVGCQCDVIRSLDYPMTTNATNHTNAARRTGWACSPHIARCDSLVRFVPLALDINARTHTFSVHRADWVQSNVYLFSISFDDDCVWCYAIRWTFMLVDSFQISQLRYTCIAFDHDFLSLRRRCSASLYATNCTVSRLCTFWVICSFWFFFLFFFYNWI